MPNRTQVLQPTRNRKSNHGAETPAIKHRNGEKLAGFPPSYRASQKDSCWNRRTSFPAECQPGLSSRAKSSSLGRVRHACCCSSSVAPAGAPTVASAHADSGRASGRSSVQSGGLCEWPSGTLHMTRRGGSGGGAPLPADEPNEQRLPRLAVRRARRAARELAVGGDLEPVPARESPRAPAWERGRRGYVRNSANRKTASPRERLRTSGARKTHSR